MLTENLKEKCSVYLLVELMAMKMAQQTESYWG